MDIFRKNKKTRKTSESAEASDLNKKKVDRSLISLPKRVNSSNFMCAESTSYEQQSTPRIDESHQPTSSIIPPANRVEPVNDQNAPAQGNNNTTYTYSDSEYSRTSSYAGSDTPHQDPHYKGKATETSSHKSPHQQPSTSSTAKVSGASQSLDAGGHPRHDPNGSSGSAAHKK
ncbi:hypothetical protein EYC84_005631 [Monilinia fructicola]|uniref:Uncharacterized protein n=1 Tax=Monilinia fructicola TaxID=38448 RepID=A0A5M9K100_MONFR|nr:hypothetical protein EYC84_005631 [Monilinia fructicola]